ncbi:MAG: hypothetical protein CSA95_07505 [Bacteroidetes bacterium]|nr:MAG: hypothetical protein CSA95_07505 [Bacteroidota bacterium]
MKKLTLLVMSLVLGFTMMAQAPTALPDDFESYNVGEQLAAQNPDLWTTWSNAPGGGEDPFISADQAQSGTKSVVIETGNDCVLPLGDLTEGNYNLQFNIYVPQGFIGYYNVLQLFNGQNSKWGLEVFFAPNGEGKINAGGENAATFNFNYDTWFTIENLINLTYDEAKIVIDGQEYVSWQWSKGALGENNLNQLGAANFYAWDQEGTPRYYVDDIDLVEVGFGGNGEPPVNLTATVFDDWFVNLQWDAPGTQQSSVLWDQLDQLGEGYGKSAQDFESDYDVYDSEVAADFVLQTDATINKVAFLYSYNSNHVGNTDPRAFNVSIFADENGMPVETPLYSTTTAAVAPDENGIFEAELTDAIALEAGTYWIGYNMQLDYGTEEIQCFAGQRAGIENETPACWRNPGDGFETGYTTWTQDVVSANGDLEEVCFAIYGAEASAKDLANMNHFNHVAVEKNFQPVKLDLALNTINKNVYTPAKTRDLIGYNLYRDGNRIAEEITELTFEDGPLDPGSYAYVVTAVYPEGESDPEGPITVVIDAGMPQMVVTPEELNAQVPFGTTQEEVLNIANEGNADLIFEIFTDYAEGVQSYASAPHIFKEAPQGIAHLVSAESNNMPSEYQSGKDRDMLWDNANINPSGSGLVSNGFGALPAGQNLVNAADDFFIPCGEVWNVEFIHSEGFPDESTVDPPSGFGVTFYSDAFGAPGQVIYEEIIPWTDYASQDLALALPPTLGAGRYWISIYAWYEEASNLQGHRWNWNMGSSPVEDVAVLQDQPGFFGGMEWTKITDLGITEKSMFFVLEGTKTTSEKWLSFDPQNGLVAPTEDYDITVTFDPSALENPVSGENYEATVKVFANDPSLPLKEIPVLMVLYTGVEEETIFVAIYPNPAIDAMNIQSNENIENIRIMNLAGQTLVSTNVDAKHYVVNAAEFDAGIYFVQIKTSHGISTQKIVVQ